MHLVTVEGAQGLWVHLEPETPEKAMALETSAARGNGRTGTVWAVETLRRLAERLGYQVGVPVRQPSLPSG